MVTKVYRQGPLTQTDDSGLVSAIEAVSIAKEDFDRLEASAAEIDGLRETITNLTAQRDDLKSEIKEWQYRLRMVESDKMQLEQYADHNFTQYNALWHQHLGYTAAVQHIANTLGAGMAYPPNEKLLNPVASQNAAMDPNQRIAPYRNTMARDEEERRG